MTTAIFLVIILCLLWAICSVAFEKIGEYVLKIISKIFGGM